MAHSWQSLTPCYFRGGNCSDAMGGAGTHSFTSINHRCINCNAFPCVGHSISSGTCAGVRVGTFTAQRAQWWAPRQQSTMDACVPHPWITSWNCTGSVRGLAAASTWKQDPSFDCRKWALLLQMVMVNFAASWVVFGNGVRQYYSVAWYLSLCLYSHGCCWEPAVAMDLALLFLNDLWAVYVLV